MPPLETDRLLVRPFVMDDLAAIHQILDVELSDVNTGTAGTQTLQARRAALQWLVLNYEQLALLYQPPYGDRAIVLRQTGELIGACGYVPAMGPFGLLPSLRGGENDTAARRSVPEFGLYWAISPQHQRQGYASEAARALIDYAFTQLNLKRIVATTSYDNAASLGVMRKVGMRVERNPQAEPAWFQAVGIIDNTR